MTTKPRTTIRCYEVSKHDQGECFKRGTIQMAVEGIPSLVEQADQALKANWKSALITEEGEIEGTVAVFFIIRRDQKAEFMAEYRAIKAQLASR